MTVIERLANSIVVPVVVIENAKDAVPCAKALAAGGVDTYVETLDGKRDRINNAHFMMVAIDENNKPVQVPRLLLQTEDEHLAWAHGEERRRIRNQRRKDKLDGI